METAPLANLNVQVLDCEHRTPSAQDVGHPYIAIPDIQEGRVVLSTTRRISDADLANWTRRTTPQAGDILVTRRGRVGDTAPIPVDGCAIGQNLVLLRTDGTRVRRDFLRWAVRSPKWWQEVDRLTNVGAVFSSLNVSDISKMAIPVPPLHEQEAIAEVLGALDDKIAANRVLVNTAEELMVALVSNLPMEGILADLCTLSRASVTPGGMADRVWHYSLPSFDEHRLPQLEFATSIKSNKFVVTKPAVLLSKLNPRFPRVWNLPAPQEHSVASTEFLVLEPTRHTTSVLWALLSCQRVSDFLGEHAAGTSGSHQRAKPAEVMAMPMPTDLPGYLQEVLDALGLRAESAKTEGAHLGTLRDILLPALMDGTLRVKDAEQTVGEVL